MESISSCLKTHCSVPQDTKVFQFQDPNVFKFLLLESDSFINEASFAKTAIYCLHTGQQFESGGEE